MYPYPTQFQKRIYELFFQINLMTFHLTWLAPRFHRHMLIIAVNDKKPLSLLMALHNEKEVMKENDSFSEECTQLTT